ncbi:MAG: magnesium transporter [Lachnospiraceae bacterium]|nr:magnesium transporter [Lachnospiraceae bacterium]MBD5481525.1 magnesium transporter [Lachnospiraceae bacterium]
MADKTIYSDPERPDYEPELIRLIQSDLPEEELREQLSRYHDNDISNVLAALTPLERKRLYHVLGVDAVSDIFAYLEDDVAKYIEELDAEKAADIIESMDADDAVDVLDELEDDKSNELIRLIDAQTRRDIDLIQSYEEDELGSHMTTNFVVIRNDFTIKQAMRSLVEQAADNDNISTIYVTDDNGVFCGAIDLTDLIIARQNVALSSLITTSFPYVYATETVDDCLEQLKDYSEDSIPVLDNDKRLLGIITAQDIVEVVDEQMSEDYARFAGLTEEEELNEPLSASIKKRIPWLITLLFLGLFVSTVAGMFEQVIAQLTLIVSFQSLILGMAGNVGTQSLAVTIRVLVDEELERGARLKLVLKELRIGMVNGLLLGSLSFTLIGFYIHFAKGRPPMFSFAVSGCIGLSLLVAMIISSLMGTIIPLFFHKLHVDPAVASGPLISTINDLIAVITYYGLAWALLLQVLHLVE